MALLPLLKGKDQPKDGIAGSFKPVRLPENIGWCARGKHNLIPVFQVGQYSCSTVVRWCTCCGAVVVDLDADGRTRPGYHRELQAPELAKALAGK